MNLRGILDNEYVQLLLLGWGVPLVLLGGGLLLFLAALAPGTRQPPTDDDLIENLRAHAVEFDRLVAMSDEDAQLAWVGSTFRSSELGLTRERLDQYRDLFDTLGIEGGLTRNRWEDTPLVVSLFVWGQGMLDGSSYKGYAYCRTPPSPLVTSLDTARETGTGRERVFRHVDGDWYLFYWP
jgi:hypothetical protein